MKKLAYAIITCTALVMASFAPTYIDRLAAVFVFFAFASLTVMTNEKQ